MARILRLTHYGLFVLVASLGIGAATFAAEYRTWTDSTGLHKMRAKLESVEDGKAVLVREDGKKQKVALGKLSKADREYIARHDTDSPFESADGDSEGSEEEAEDSSSKGPKTVNVKWSKSKAILLEGRGDAEWKVEVPAAPASEFQPKSVPFPGKKDFFDKITGVAFSRVAKKAVIGYTLDGPGAQQAKTVRLILCSLEDKRVTAQASISCENMMPLALHEDGRRVVMRSNEFGFGKHGRLEIWSIQGKKIERSVAWTPYEGSDGRPADVTWAEFADAETLITAGDDGKIVFWNFEKVQPICHIQAQSGTIPALSADGKLLAVVGEQTLGLFSVEKRELLGAQEVPKALFWATAAFSPSGRKIVVVSQARIMTWDTATGKPEKNFQTPAAFGGRQVAFPDENFVLVGGSGLIELQNQVGLWEYNGAEAACVVDGTTFFVIPGDAGGGLLLAMKLPHAAAKDVLTKALKQPDLFVFKKGAPVKLDMAGISDASARTKVSEALMRKLADMGCPIHESAQVTLQATVEGPKAREVTFMHSGTYTVQEYITRLKILYGRQAIWEESSTNVPGMLQIRQGENIEGKLREAGAKPAYDWYENVALPEFLQKPSSGQAAMGRGQTLGSSRLTAGDAMPRGAGPSGKKLRSRL